MGCPTTPLSCLEPSNIFAGVYSPACGGFADPSALQAEQAVFRSAFSEQINNYGVDVNYYINGFNLEEANILYGEHPTQEYAGPFTLKAYLELNEAYSITMFGMRSDDELTAYIGIKDFTNKFIEEVYLITETDYNISTNPDIFPIVIDNYGQAFFLSNGQRIEPKSDDLMEITALGCDRPGNRGAKIFRITEVLDQSVQDGINPMMGHYLWRIKAVRYETSHETNAPQELGNDQVYDNAFSGKESSTIYPTLTTSPKVYTQDIDTISQTEVYDMEKNDTSIYGGYY